jgi:hypothetical protein
MNIIIVVVIVAVLLAVTVNRKSHVIRWGAKRTKGEQLFAVTVIVLGYMLCAFGLLNLLCRR